MHPLSGHFEKYHNTLCLSPQIVHKHCFQFLLGLKMVPRENKNNAYAKFGRINKEYYGQRSLTIPERVSGGNRAYLPCESEDLPLNLDQSFLRLHLQESTSLNSAQMRYWARRQVRALGADQSKADSGDESAEEFAFIKHFFPVILRF